MIERYNFLIALVKETQRAYFTIRYAHKLDKHQLTFDNIKVIIYAETLDDLLLKAINYITDNREYIQTSHKYYLHENLTGTNQNHTRRSSRRN